MVEHSDSNLFVLGASIRFVKKSAIQFGRCIRLINDDTAIVPYSAVVFAQRSATDLAYVT